MSRVLPALARRSLVGGAVVAFVFFAVGLAQKGASNEGAGAHSPETSNPCALVQGKNEAKTVCILIQVKNQDVQPIEIEETLKFGARKLKYGSPQISATRLRPETLAEIQRIISNLESSRTGSKKGQPIISQKVSDQNIEWEVDLNVPETGVVLRKLVLTLKDKKEPKVIELSISKDKPSPVSPTVVPGVYVVRLAQHEIPIKYVAHFHSAENREIREVSGAWPATQQCFLVTIKGLQGDYKTLLDFVRRADGDTQNVANPIDDFEQGPDIAMVFAAIGFKHIRQGSILDEKRWVPIVRPRDGEKSNRVWMLFPLTREETEKKLLEYRKLAPTELSKKIRAEPHKWSEANPELMIIHTKLTPTWIELPYVKKEQGFSRELRIENVRALQKTLPEAYRLIVYEFGDPEDSSAQAVEENSRRVWVIGEAIKEWPEGIKEAANKAVPK